MSPEIQTEGEFAGWSYWPGDKFEYDTVGPFYYRKDDAGEPVCAFRAEPRHMNGLGHMHGGCMMSFADFSLFGIADDVLDEESSAVTVTLNSEFIGGAEVGDLMEARGEIIRAGRSIIFIRGILTANGEPCLNYSGTIKKTRRRTPTS